jgi:hypothetical protein
MLFEQINSGEFAEIINKAYIVCMFFHRERSRAPYIRKYLLQGSSGNTGRCGIW